ncbi:hypothetical protein ACFL5Z_14935 [Planctomycetota bacterium]
MNPSVFEGLAKRFSQCRAECLDKVTHTDRIESIMTEAGENLFDAIFSTVFRFELTPMWLKREPKSIKILNDPYGEAAEVEVCGWSLYWVFAIDWLRRTHCKCENELPEAVFWADAERLLGGYVVDEYLNVKHVKYRSELWNQTWQSLIGVSEEVCSCLAHMQSDRYKPAGTEQKNDAAEVPAENTGDKVHKYQRVRKWAEDYIRQHSNSAPATFNALLRLVRANVPDCKGCSPETLKKAVNGSPTLQTWESKIKEWAANKKRANTQPGSLEVEMQPAPDSEDLRAIPDDGTPLPEVEADTKDRVDRLCSMPVEELLKKVKGTFFNWIKWTDDVEGGRKRNPGKEWEKLQQAPEFDAESKESLARFYLALDGQIKEILRHDPNAKNDPIKHRYLLNSGL